MLEDEKSIFDDLPLEGEPAKPEAPSEDDKKKAEEDIKRLKIANKIEDDKLSKLKEELAKKRAERKRLKMEGVDDGDEEDEEAPAEKPKEGVDVQKSVQDALRNEREKERRERIALKVRAVAKNRQEAEEAYAMILSLPTTGDDDLDARFGFDRIRAIREKSRGFVAPSLGGGGSFTDFQTRPTDELEGFSKERLAWLEAQGVSKEDVKKYHKSGPDFARLFPKTIINNR